MDQDNVKGAPMPHMTADEEARSDAQARKYADALGRIRDDGYAVVVFTPAELAGARADAVEETMIARGWDTIDDLSDVDGDDSDGVDSEQYWDRVQLVCQLGDVAYTENLVDYLIEHRASSNDDLDTIGNDVIAYQSGEHPGAQDGAPSTVWTVISQDDATGRVEQTCVAAADEWAAFASVASQHPGNSDRSLIAAVRGAHTAHTPSESGLSCAATDYPHTPAPSPL